MIGKIYISICKYFDKNTKQNRFKQRPVLIIGQADKFDFVVLPISTVTNKDNLNEKYDFELQPNEFPLIGLKRVCYIRTHKQTIINRADLKRKIIDFQAEYSDTYKTVLKKVKEFQNEFLDI